MRILLSRTDSIGDVILSLPMAGFIKEAIPDAHIIFMGKSYTKDVILCSEHVDEFLNWDDFSNLPDGQAVQKMKALNANAIVHVFPRKEIAQLAKKAELPLRIGTTGRIYHLLTCNKLIRFSRKRSDLHESQLNLKLLDGLGIKTEASLEEVNSHMGFTRLPGLPNEAMSWLALDKKNIILHPTSQGSAVEWGLDNFNALIKALPQEKYKVFISGTKEDEKFLHGRIDFGQSHVTSILGKLSLKDFIAFIAHCDGLVAASTGPLHIAAALDKLAIGLYSPRRPIHPGRWKPIGKQAKALVFKEGCIQCAKGEKCNCIQDIKPQSVSNLLNETFFGHSEKEEDY